MYIRRQRNIASLKKSLWRRFSLYIRLRDSKDGYGKCISCGKIVPLDGSFHAGHYYPKSTTYASLYFDEQNVNGQCNYCNRYLEGNKQGYAKGLVKKYGKDILDVLDIKKSFKSHWGVHEYESLIEKYKQMVIR